MKATVFVPRALLACASAGVVASAGACTSILGDLPGATIAADASTEGGPGSGDGGGDASVDGATQPESSVSIDSSMPVDSSALPESSTQDSGATPDSASVEDSGAGGEAGADAGCSGVCVAGTTQCATTDGGTVAQKCEVQSNGCTAWGVSQACSSEQSCSEGDAGAACVCQQTGCSVAGPVCLTGTTLATCTQDPASGCLYASATTTCAAPQSCSGPPGSAACSTQCSSSCPSAGAKECMSGGVATCALQSNGCLAWDAPVACASNQTCTVSGSSASCVCNNPAACDGVAGKTCTQGLGYVDCTTDANGCLVATTESCASNQTCGGSAGAASCSCVNAASCKGATGETCTSSSAYVTCTHDTNDCLVASGSGTCSTNETCTGSTPGSEGCTCASPYSICGGSCVDTSTSASNCGTCNHGCLGGTCSGGMCQPVTLVTGLTQSTSASALAVDATNVYWTDVSYVYLCSINGGCGAGTNIYAAYSDPTLGFTDLIEALATPAATSPYAGDVYAIEESGGNDSRVAQISATSHAVVNDDVNAYAANGIAFDSVNTWVYYFDDGDGVPNKDAALRRVKPDGTLDGAVLGGLLAPPPGSNPAVDSQYVYIADYGTTGNVYWCSLTGTCSASNVAFGPLITPGGVASNGTYVFATEKGATANSGAVYKCAAGTNCGKPTPLAAGQNGPSSIVADATNVYWLAGTSVYRCPVAGCGAGPTLFASGVATPIVQDAAAIYYGTSTGIMKVAK